ncbi:MAG: c-di-GMP-binding flagellar brake protein YcgR [Oleiphilaceae bacterium]
MENMMTNDDLNTEKRKYIRQQLRATGLITFEDGSQYKGAVRDFSIGGTFLETPNIGQDQLNVVVVASINVEIQNSVRTIEAMCKIARVADDGVGLFYHSMDEHTKQDFIDILKEIRKGLDEIGKGENPA